MRLVTYGAETDQIARRGQPVPAGPHYSHYPESYNHYPELPFSYYRAVARPPRATSPSAYRSTAPRPPRTRAIRVRGALPSPSPGTFPRHLPPAFSAGQAPSYAAIDPLSRHSLARPLAPAFPHVIRIVRITIQVKLGEEPTRFIASAIGWVFTLRHGRPSFREQVTGQLARQYMRRNQISIGSSVRLATPSLRYIRVRCCSTVLTVI